MNSSAAARSLLVVVAVCASALGVACSNPVGPREAVAAPRASVRAVAAKEANNEGPKGDSTTATPMPTPESGAYSGGGVLPWF